jgi:hypothetical protein
MWIAACESEWVPGWASGGVMVMVITAMMAMASIRVELSGSSTTRPARSQDVSGPCMNVVANAPICCPPSRVTDPSVDTIHSSPGLVGGRARPYTRLSSSCVKGTTKAEFGRWVRCLGWRCVGSSARPTRIRSSALMAGASLVGAELMAASHLGDLPGEHGSATDWLAVERGPPLSVPIASVTQMQPRS